MKPDQITPPDIDPGDAIEVMRIWRDLSDGSLIIQMGNERYRSMSEIRNPDLARRFAAVVRELWEMISGAASARSTETLPPATGASPAQVPPGESERVTRLKTLSPQPSRRGRKSESEPPPALGIVQEIEDFLQIRLLASPEFATRSIHIRPSHDHGLQIEVDGHYYDSIADIVDPDVRDFLSAMMKEWEARK